MYSYDECGGEKRTVAVSYECETLSLTSFPLNLVIISSGDVRETAVQYLILYSYFTQCELICFCFTCGTDWAIELLSPAYIVTLYIWIQSVHANNPPSWANISLLSDKNLVSPKLPIYRSRKIHCLLLVEVKSNQIKSKF